MLPWGQLLRAAHSAFGIFPEQFWAMPVREWRLLQHPAAPYANGAILSALMEQFPDSLEDKNHEHNGCNRQ